MSPSAYGREKKIKQWKVQSQMSKEGRTRYKRANYVNIKVTRQSEKNSPSRVESKKPGDIPGVSVSMARGY